MLKKTLHAALLIGSLSISAFTFASSTNGYINLDLSSKSQFAYASIDNLIQQSYDLTCHVVNIGSSAKVTIAAFYADAVGQSVYKEAEISSGKSFHVANVYPVPKHDNYINTISLLATFATGSTTEDTKVLCSYQPEA